MKEAEALDQAVETGANTVPQPPPGMNEEAADDGEHTNGNHGHSQDVGVGRATRVSE